MSDIDERLTPENIVARCLLDFVRRGGIHEGNVQEAGAAVIGSLNHLLPGIRDDMSFSKIRQMVRDNAALAAKPNFMKDVPDAS